MGLQTLLSLDVIRYSVNRTKVEKEMEGVKMSNLYTYECMVRSHIQDAHAEAEHDRLAEIARAALRARKLQGKRLRKSGVLKRLVTSLGHTGQ
jgi:hypothetical protein